VPNFFPVGADDRLELDDLYKHLGRWILMKDAPEHGRLRKSMNSGFSPAVIEKLKPHVVSVVEELLRQLELVAEPDLIRDLAYPLPVRVISRLLGVPDSLHAECVALSNDFASWFGDPMRTTAAARTAQAAVRRLVALFETIVRERNGKKEGDLLDLMLEIARQAELTAAELHAQCVLLLIAGHETTRNLIGNGIYTLLRHPEALEEVRASESAVRAAVEEVLRYESPVQAYGRGATEDIDYDGVRIPAGSAVLFIIAAAHRDPRHVSDPDRFDIHRKHNRHLAFGTDAHVCLGSTLARLEGQIAIGETSRLWGAGLVLRKEVCADCAGRISALVGYRFLRATDDLSISTNEQGNVPGIGVFAEAVTDQFGTADNFSGLDLGLTGETRLGAWTFEWLGKLAVGANYSTAQVNGATILSGGGGPPMIFAAGVLAAANNSGNFNATRFAVAPELAVKAGYQVTPQLQLHAGYDLLFWSNVVRPGGVIDTAINPNQLPPSPPVAANRPAPRLDGADFWAHGIEVGADFSF